MQLEEFAPCVGHAGDLCYTECEAGLVAAKIIADQLALPVLQEVARMLAGTAEAEVINHCRSFAKWAGGISPDIRAVGFLGAWHEHLHWRFIDMNDLLLKHDFAQRIHQRLQLHTASTDPLRKGRTRNRQAGPAKHRFLTVQR
ncbi:hypothetical protein D3C81_1395010 [compost metagenome]